MDSNQAVTKAALLYDIGTIISRAENIEPVCTESTLDFLKSNLSDTPFRKELIQHATDLIESSNLPHENKSVIFRLAQEIVESMEKTPNIKNKPFVNTQPLQNIFTYFGGKQSEKISSYPLTSINEVPTRKYPITSENTEITRHYYEELLLRLKEKIAGQKLENMSMNNLLVVLEDLISYIPAGSYKTDVADISLYTKAKVRGGIISCLTAAIQDNEFDDTSYENLKKENLFLLVSADFSGIQNFIYTIPSKGALKSLRGRSFYLEIFLENVIDELLEELGLSRSNLLYSGGGHFYLLAPNTERTKEIIDKVQASCNQWLLKEFSTKLYIAFGYSLCNANMLMHSEEQRNMFAETSKAINEHKMKRYEKNDLTNLFDEHSEYNTVTNGSLECAVCHTSTRSLKKSKLVDGETCELCEGLYRLGEKMIESPTSLFAILEEASNLITVPIWSLTGSIYLSVITANEIDTLKSKGILRRLYGKNIFIDGYTNQVRLWLADYVMKSNDNVYSFEQLAKASINETHGIKRLGVMRADVDNLGAAFISGFINSDPKKRHQYCSFTRYADLSRNLSMFFKQYVNDICKGHIEGARFRLFGKAQNNEAYKVHIVYSGGDDMFFVGAWEYLIELAINIRTAFAKFTDNKLSFSAGIALFNDSYPISKMAEITGVLEELAKKMPAKDSVALFGLDTKISATNELIRCNHIYRWDTFATKVCQEKLAFLMDVLQLSDGKIKDDMIGKSFLYRLMDFMEALQDDELAKKDSINLARLVYMLARLEPKNDKDKVGVENFKKFSAAMYKWAKNSEDRMQLLTALHFIVYYLRETERA